MLIVTLAFALGCQRSPAVVSSAPAVATTVAADPAAGGAPAKKDPPAPTHPAFDAKLAFDLLRKQCDFGPRYLGAPAHEKTLNFLLTEMRKYADDTVTQKFNFPNTASGLPVTNVIGIFYPAGSKEPSKRPVLLMAHWDTRPIADGPYSSELKKGPFTWDGRKWNRLAPILGANDGASGVAVLLELARLFKKQPPPVGVLLLLDDGEDYGDFRANNDTGEGVELGARYFARHYLEEPRFGHPDYGILLDMIGGKNMKIPSETFSEQYAPATNEKVFRIGGSLGYNDIFLLDAHQSVGDDHLSINQVGHISTIDLIQPLPSPGGPEYAYMQWHTLQDTPENCSEKSLKIVGDTIAEVIYQETPSP